MSFYPFFGGASPWLQPEECTAVFRPRDRDLLAGDTPGIPPGLRPCTPVQRW